MILTPSNACLQWSCRLLFDPEHFLISFLCIALDFLLIDVARNALRQCSMLFHLLVNLIHASVRAEHNAKSTKLWNTSHGFENLHHWIHCEKCSKPCHTIVSQGVVDQHWWCVSILIMLFFFLPLCLWKTWCFNFWHRKISHIFIQNDVIQVNCILGLEINCADISKLFRSSSFSFTIFEIRSTEGLSSKFLVGTCSPLPIALLVSSVCFLKSLNQACPGRQKKMEGRGD